jgi:hypothetical protein
MKMQDDWARPWGYLSPGSPCGTARIDPAAPAVCGLERTSNVKKK